MPRTGLAVERSASRAAATVGLLLPALLLSAAPARGELAFFATGRALSVAGHRVEAGQIVLLLRNGGEMTVPATMLTGFAPDEVPQEEPAAPRGGVSADADSAAPPDHLIQHPEFDALIRRAAAIHGVDVSLVRAVVQVESGYQPASAPGRARWG